MADRIDEHFRRRSCCFSFTRSSEHRCKWKKKKNINNRRLLFCLLVEATNDDKFAISRNCHRLTVSPGKMIAHWIDESGESAKSFSKVFDAAMRKMISHDTFRVRISFLFVVASHLQPPRNLKIASPFGLCEHENDVRLTHWDAVGGRKKITFCRSKLPISSELWISNKPNDLYYVSLPASFAFRQRRPGCVCVCEMWAHFHLFIFQSAHILQAPLAWRQSTQHTNARASACAGFVIRVLQALRTPKW